MAAGDAPTGWLLVPILSQLWEAFYPSAGFARIRRPHNTEYEGEFGFYTSATYAHAERAREMLCRDKVQEQIHHVTIIVIPFPDPPVLRAKEGLVYKVGILGCAESACSENG